MKFVKKVISTLLFSPFLFSGFDSVCHEFDKLSDPKLDSYIIENSKVDNVQIDVAQKNIKIHELDRYTYNYKSYIDTKPFICSVCNKESPKNCTDTENLFIRFATDEKIPRNICSDCIFNDFGSQVKNIVKMHVPHYDVKKIFELYGQENFTHRCPQIIPIISDADSSCHICNKSVDLNLTDIYYHGYYFCRKGHKYHTSCVETVKCPMNDGHTLEKFIPFQENIEVYYELCRIVDEGPDKY